VVEEKTGRKDWDPNADPSEYETRHSINLNQQFKRPPPSFVDEPIPELYNETIFFQWQYYLAMAIIFINVTKFARDPNISDPVNSYVKSVQTLCSNIQACFLSFI
jgi:hypothetical protein